MTPTSDILNDLRSLLDALCEETITAEQLQQLERLILAHPEAEAYYVQYMSQYADLCGQLSGSGPRAAAGLPVALADACSLCEPARSVQRAASAPRRFGLGRVRLLAWGMLAAAAVTAAALWLLEEPPQSRGTQAGVPAARPDPHAPHQPEPLDNTVAVLLRAPGAEWEPGGLPVQSGAALAPGRLRLRSGFAHIQFYSGASVILEGPADFEVISPLEAYCARGKLRATVPAQAQGFTIGSPRLDLIDRGTEFGMQVDGPESTEIHVFDGKVELYDSGSARTAAPRTELTTGQAVRVDGPGAGSAIPFDPAAFLTAAELVVRSEAELRRRHRDWLASSAGLRDDSDLVLYYSFQSEQAWGRTIANVAGDSERSAEGVIVGCSQVTGRWPGKQALEFKRISDRIRLHVAGEFDALTLATWVRVDGLSNPFNSLFMTDSWDEREPHWHISADGKLELGVQGPGRKGVHYYSPAVFTPERLGHWVHLAVTYDRPGGWVAHYVDGRPVMEQPLELDVPLVIGDVEIGNWNATARRHNHPIRYFSGRMDEFLLYARALDADEIGELHAQGRRR